MYFQCRVAMHFLTRFQPHEQLQTNKCNRLGFDTVKTELVIRNNLAYDCSEFFEEIKKEKNVLNATKNTAKYTFKNVYFTYIIPILFYYFYIM